MKWLAVLLAFLVLPAAAFADVEPNDNVFQAEGPISAAAPISGTIFNGSDNDWYLAYVSSQTQTDVTVTTTSADCNYSARLYGHDYSPQTSTTIYGAGTEHLRYTTPPDTTRVFVRVSEAYGTCESAPYTLSFSPPAAFVGGEPSSPGTPTGEPNEAVTQAWGPLTGGVLYSGSKETINDVDWLYFHTAGPAELQIPVAEPFGSCNIEARLYSGVDLETSLASASSSFSVRWLSYRAPGAGTYYLRLTAGWSSCEGTPYQLRVYPPEALTATPPPTTVSVGAGGASPTTARVRGSKVRVVIKGRLGLPAGVDAARACNGASMLFTIKKGTKLISTRGVTLTRSCRFEKVVNLARSKVGSAKRLNVTARFQGNALLSGSTRTFSVRVRR